RIRRGSAGEARGQRGQYILDVMESAKKDLIASCEDPLFPARSRNQVPSAEKQSLVQFALDTKHRNVRPQPFCPARYDLIISVQNGQVLLGLIQKYPMLSSRILSKRFVSIEMIWRHIQTDRDVCPEILDRLKLEARKLGYRPGPFTR